MNGGGIWTAGTLTLNGGTITRNSPGSSNSGGGVYYSDGVFIISGSPVISGNTKNNLFIVNSESGGLLNINGLITGASIGVTLEDGEGTVTNFFGISGNGPEQLECFVSDSSAYMIGIDNSQEVVLGAPVTVSFDPGQGTGTMEPVRVARGSYYALPGSTFTPHQYMSFDSWTVNGEAGFTPDSFIFIDGDTTLTAAWKEGLDISYIDENGESQIHTATQLTGGESVLSAGWDAVVNNISFGRRPTVSGDVKLILCDGATLTAGGGIWVEEGNKLTIYGQTDGRGAP